MGHAGFVVRFVDVVLILLFGFISISSIQLTEVELPTSRETPPVPPDPEEVVFVGIRGDGTFLVQDETRELHGASALAEYLAAVTPPPEIAPVRVRIRASHDTPVFFLLQASRVCEALGIPKAFEVRMADGSG